MQLLAWLSAVCVSLSGLFVLFNGDWRMLRLKYAAVSISTLASFWVLTVMAMDGGIGLHCTRSPMFCLTIQFYICIKNVVLILFNAAVGRDAISLKKHRERRTWTRNS